MSIFTDCTWLCPQAACRVKPCMRGGTRPAAQRAIYSWRPSQWVHFPRPFICQVSSQEITSSFHLPKEWAFKNKSHHVISLLKTPHSFPSCSGCVCSSPSLCLLVWASRSLLIPGYPWHAPGFYQSFTHTPSPTGPERCEMLQGSGLSGLQPRG